MAPKIVVYSAKPYDQHYLKSADGIDVEYIDLPLSTQTTSLAAGADAVCIFVNDEANAAVLTALQHVGVHAILLRCAGFNNVDLGAAERLGLFVANVPSYSPEAVAEFAVALLQTLNRHTHRAYNRVREANFSLEGLLGRTLRGRTVGVIGTGRIGVCFARVMSAGFGCRVLGFDPFENDEFRRYGEYADLHAVLSAADFVSLHCPLMDATRYIINADSLARMKPGALLVNTSRGGLIETGALLSALKSRHLGGVALDVYEGEGGLFYTDHSGNIIDDDLLMRLTTFHNVIMSGHQAFFTEEALQEIAVCTLSNMADFVAGRECKNELAHYQKPVAVPPRT
ncbi:putative dehydrogenase tr07 [Diatrype stigma]|uniref:Dehydrogenase tr07 n=1 Tax=Diatrype stigma TaxID=117547 RepID=A0AAN9YSH8_9PEZI